MHATEQQSRFVTPAQACQALGVCQETLRRWSRCGRIRYIQGGDGTSRRYDVSSVIKGINTDNDVESIDIIYARVSTRAQRKHLDTQSERLVQRFGKHALIVRDIGSGLNFKRPGLKKILERVMRGQVRRVYVSHKDRLCRFAFDLLEFICSHHGTEIVVADDGDAKTSESELADDIVSIITVFGARLYGSRSKRRGGKKESAHVAEDAFEGSIAELQDEDAPDDVAEEGTEDVVCSSSEGIQQSYSACGEGAASSKHD